MNDLPNIFQTTPPAEPFTPAAPPVGAEKPARKPRGARRTGKAPELATPYGNDKITIIESDKPTTATLRIKKPRKARKAKAPKVEPFVMSASNLLALGASLPPEAATLVGKYVDDFNGMALDVRNMVLGTLRKIYG